MTFEWMLTASTWGNLMPFTNCQGPCLDFAGPDTVLLPPGVPAAGPNAILGSSKIPGQTKVLLNCACFAHNLATKAPMSIGPAGGPGMASGTCMGPGCHLFGSTAVILGGTPATKLGSPSLQNNGNAFGATVATCQTKHIILR